MPRRLGEFQISVPLWTVYLFHPDHIHLCPPLTVLSSFIGGQSSTVEPLVAPVEVEESLETET